METQVSHSHIAEREGIDMKNPGYLDSTLSKSEVAEFLHKYNRPDERRCIWCRRIFDSEGAHNRKCPGCKAHQKLNENNQIRFDMPVHKMSGKFRPHHHFCGEIE